MSGSFGSLSLPAPSVISLGGFTFQGFECPAQINYGGAQQITVHKLPGGARVIDDIGDDPVPITWSGLFYGLGAGARRDQLQAMRMQSGARLLELAFDDQHYLVKIRELTFEMLGPNRIGYRITCEVMPAIVSRDRDDANLGDGSKPTTEVEAKDQGQQAVTKARGHASSIPVPPIPPTQEGITPTLPANEVMQTPSATAADAKAPVIGPIEDWVRTKFPGG